MALRSLPPECTELVLRHLWDDVSTLHALLLCNRELFSLVVPVLYKDPFRLLDSHRIWTRTSKTKRSAYLIRLLRACSVTKPNQQDTYSGDFLVESAAAVSLTTVEEGAGQPLKGPTISVPSSFSPVNNGMLLLASPQQQEQQDFGSEEDFDPISTPLTVDYLFHYTQQAQIPKAFLAFKLLNPSVQQYLQGRTAFELAFAKDSMALSLALFGHFPSRIQTLSMTPSQLGVILLKEHGHPVHGGVEALRSLRRLELDFGATNSPLSRWAGVSSGPQAFGNNSGDGALAVNVEVTDVPLLFIQEHQRLFPTSPEDAAVDHSRGKGLATGLNSASPAPKTDGTLLQEIMIRGAHRTWTPTQLLTNILPLKTIDLSAWNSDVPHLEHIPASRLRSLKTNIARRLDFVEVQVSYLREQCRELQEIWMPSQVADTFQWAIDVERSIGQFSTEARHRRRLRRTIATEGGSEMAIQGLVVAEQSRAEKVAVDSSTSMPPRLRKVRLYGGPQELIPCLEDAADAFRDSLEELAGYEDGYGRRDEYPRMSIDWTMPRLTYLDLRGRFVFFFDVRSLRNCPDLRVVKLFIESNIGPDLSSNGNGSRQGRIDFGVFAGMKRLEELQLRGTSWGVDDSALEALMGCSSGGRSCSSSSPTGQEQMPTPWGVMEEGIQQVEKEPFCLQDSLEYFGIAESHLPSKAALIRFVRAMKKLRVISLGTTKGHAVEALKDAAGRRLFVELNSSDA